eukprot:107632_1
MPASYVFNCIECISFLKQDLLEMAANDINVIVSFMWPLEMPSSNRSRMAIYDNELTRQHFVRNFTSNSVTFESTSNQNQVNNKVSNPTTKYETELEFSGYDSNPHLNDVEHFKSMSTAVNAQTRHSDDNEAQMIAEEKRIPSGINTQIPITTETNTDQHSSISGLSPTIKFIEQPMISCETTGNVSSNPFKYQISRSSNTIKNNVRFNDCVNTIYSYEDIDEKSEPTPLMDHDSRETLFVNYEDVDDDNKDELNNKFISTNDEAEIKANDDMENETTTTVSTSQNKASIDSNPKYEIDCDESDHELEKETQNIISSLTGIQLNRLKLTLNDDIDKNNNEYGDAIIYLNRVINKRDPEIQKRDKPF